MFWPDGRHAFFGRAPPLNLRQSNPDRAPVKKVDETTPAAPPQVCATKRLGGMPG